MSEIIKIKWWWIKHYVHKWSCFFERIWTSLKQITIKNEDRFKLLGQSARAQRCFDLYFDLIEENLAYLNLISIGKYIKGRKKHKIEINLKLFEVPIGNTKCVEEMKFHIKDPMLKYFQNSLNSCIFGSLSSSFDSINQTKSINAIAMCIEELLTNQVGNCIDFANAILKTQKRVKGEKKF